MITNITLGLSRRWHLPVLFFMGGTFPLWEFPKLLSIVKQWKIKEQYYARDYDFEVVHQSGAILRLHYSYLKLMLREWDIWDETYLPPFPLIGKTVLDAGSGEGETVLKYLLHGASKIICVEENAQSVKLLRINAMQNKWNIEIRNKSFSKEDLVGVDFAKIDVEGGEECLLELDDLPCPCVMEIHGEHLQEAMLKKFRMRIVKPGVTVKTMVNFS
jgi:hypothetical protein